MPSSCTVRCARPPTLTIDCATTSARGSTGVRHLRICPRSKHWRGVARPVTTRCSQRFSDGAGLAQEDHNCCEPDPLSVPNSNARSMAGAVSERRSRCQWGVNSSLAPLLRFRRNTTCPLPLRLSRWLESAGRGRGVAARRLFAGFERLIARLVLFVGRIKPGQRRAFEHFVHDPAFEPLLLWREL